MKRMLLMPAQNLTSPLVSKISRLDAEMKTVLDKSDLDDETKASAYSQVLSKYLSARGQYARPIPVPIIDVPSPSATSTELLLDAIPKNYMKKAQVLVDHIRKSPDIGWNERKELVLEGKTVANSNIIDLVDDLVRPKAKRDPRGIEDFVHALKKDNIPETLINNHGRWDGKTASSISTPSPTAKKKKRKTGTQTGRGLRWSRW